MRLRRRQRGAVLLILLTVVGLGAATLLIGALGKQRIEAARERRTLDALELASEALLGFAATNGRLPRPAAAALDGRENPAACDSEAACTGFLPWVTLGVAGSDSWGKLLRYSVTPALTMAPIQSVSAVATKTVRRRQPGGRWRYLGGQENCDVSAQCLPFVLYSNGKNNFGTSAAGVSQPNTARGNLDEAGNQAATVQFIDRAASDNATQPGGQFDDLLRWVPLRTLYFRMRAARNLP